MSLYGYSQWQLILGNGWVFRKNKTEKIKPNYVCITEVATLENRNILGVDEWQPDNTLQ